MREFSLFNIGFRCENALNALDEYEKKGEITNKYIIEDSEKIIDDCFKFQNNEIIGFDNSKYELTDLYPLIFEIYNDISFNEMFKSLDNIKYLLTGIKGNNKTIDIKEAKDFFTKLSLLCLESNNF